MYDRMRKLLNENAAATGAVVLIVIAVLAGTLSSQVRDMHKTPTMVPIEREVMCAECGWRDKTEATTLPFDCPQCDAVAVWAAAICSECGRYSAADLDSADYATDEFAVCPRCKKGVMLPPDHQVAPPTD